MDHKIKLDLNDLQIDSFATEELLTRGPDGTVQAYLTYPCSYDNCDTDLAGDCNTNDFALCGVDSGATCDYTCYSPPCETSPAPCSMNPINGPSCDATCGQENTCVYTGPNPGCC